MSTQPQTLRQPIQPPATVTEIRPGASNEHPVVNMSPFSALIHRTLHAAGNIATLGNKAGRKPVELRRIGAVTLAGLAAAAPFTPSAAKTVYDHVLWGAAYEMTSDIPTSEAHLDPHKYVLRVIPSEGAFDFAAAVDPNHNPEQGSYNFNAQLHHAAEPGDIVAVPIQPTAKK